MALTDTSPSFAAFITTLLHSASIDLWVGLTSDLRAHFQWAKPSGLLSYTNWAPGEPLDNSGPHHNKTRVSVASKLLRAGCSSCCVSDLLVSTGKLCGDDSWESTEERWHVGLPGL